MTEVTNAALKQASLLILQDKMRQASSDAGYYKTAAVFIESTPIPETAPDAYRISETALRKVLIEKALSAQRELELLTAAFDEVFDLDD